MIKMVRSKFLFALLFVLTPTIFFSQSLITGFVQYMNSDENYLQALLNYKNAEFNYQKSLNMLTPYISLTPSLNLKQQSGNNTTLELQTPLSIELQNINGLNIKSGITFDLSYDFNSSFSNTLNLSIILTNSEIFQENTEQLSALSDYLSKTWLLTSAKNQLFLQYLKDYFNAYYLNEKLGILNKQLDNKTSVYNSKERQYNNGIISESDFIQSKIDLLTTRNDILNISSQLSGIKLQKPSKEEINLLLQLAENIKNKLPTLDEAISKMSKRPDIESLQIDVQLSRINLKNYSIQRFNPSIFFSATYPTSLDKIFSSSNTNISVGFSFSIPILDKGENKNNMDNLNKQLEISTVKLNNTIESLKLSLKNAYTQLDIYLNNLEIALLKSEQQRLSYERMVSNKNYYAQTDLSLAQLNYLLSVLEVENAKFQVLVAALNIYNLIGLDIYSYFGGELSK